MLNVSNRVSNCMESRIELLTFKEFGMNLSCNLCVFVEEYSTTLFYFMLKFVDHVIFAPEKNIRHQFWSGWLTP